MARCRFVKGKFKEQCPDEAVGDTEKCEMHTPKSKKPEPGELPVLMHEVTITFKIHDTVENTKGQLQRLRETLNWRDGFRMEVK